MEAFRQKTRRLRKSLRVMRRVGHSPGRFPLKCFPLRCRGCGMHAGTFSQFRADGVLILCGGGFAPV